MAIVTTTKYRMDQANIFLEFSALAVNQILAAQGCLFLVLEVDGTNIRHAGVGPCG